jgi:hypothetical protein
MSDLEMACGWRTVTGWTMAESDRVVRLLEEKGAMTVDRQMQPWVLRARIPATDAWRRLYDDVL